MLVLRVITIQVIVVVTILYCVLHVFNKLFLPPDVVLLFGPLLLMIKVCGMIFWAMFVPHVTFACELWVLDDDDIRILEDFQTYSGRRIQRFRQSSPCATSYVGLVWIRLEIYIYVKKMLFVRSIAMLDDTSIYKRVFTHGYVCFYQNKVAARENRMRSPTNDIFKV